ncbi:MULTISPECIES: DUF6114 domain-containing protein [Streptomyces]|uniref:Integral membrane protein n=2 Tax=Streptomyces TaxID=1883 RepID=A0A117QED6_STRCK|nr:DUF6114 domain-containing protein [Streptomyces corchorusii]AEY91764.1 integral membrane protein [Streptomyces hygroscopicus subsp. jinggangensis 5008]AGF65920.1 integral membrane protein [Streptomyces hygroscopicus subsp. jinggangensis TL01]ALO96218.1 Integral membrane protein [Streptomyces hygroscopicus subsp. limoneus]KUN23744.1 hypothetical protein AQJ11_22800 [Streptomyces corchorusii]
MSAETPAAAPGQFTRRRLQFRAWRGTRPFWAGLFVMLGGFPIMYFPYAHLQLGHLTLAMATTAGAGSLIIGVLLIVLGFSLWFQKHVRTFAGVAAILLALVSIPVSNFGGFVIGFLLALVGGALAVAWAPGTPPQEQPPTEATPDAGGAPGTAPLPHQGTTPAADAGPAGPYKAPWENDLSGTSPANGANGRHSAG